MQSANRILSCSAYANEDGAHKHCWPVFMLQVQHNAWTIFVASLVVDFKKLVYSLATVSRHLLIFFLVGESLQHLAKSVCLVVACRQYRLFVHVPLWNTQEPCFFVQLRIFYRAPRSKGWVKQILADTWENKVPTLNLPSRRREDESGKLILSVLFFHISAGICFTQTLQLY